MPYQILSPHGWQDLPPEAVMDEDTLERLLQLGLVRWRNPNLFLVLIMWLVQLFDAVFPTNAEFERRYEDRTGGTPAGSQSQSHGALMQPKPGPRWASRPSCLPSLTCGDVNRAYEPCSSVEKLNYWAFVP